MKAFSLVLLLILTIQLAGCSQKSVPKDNPVSTETTSDPKTMGKVSV